jgi:hypothetical protein
MKWRWKYFQIFSAEKEKHKNITTNFPNEIICGFKNITPDNLIIEMRIP